MANRDTPLGFFPVTKLDGSKIPTKQFLATSVGSNLFVGDVVSKAAAGDVEPATANDGNTVVGVVTAIYDTAGTPIGHPNSSIATKYLASGSSGIVTVALGLPDAMFRVQASGATNAADVFNTANHVVGTGNVTTARSVSELDTSSQSSSGSAQLLIIDKVDDPSNDWGENVMLLVVFNESTFVGGVVGV